MNHLYDVAAPAKLNLFLHVLGQRDDGYHRLQSVFMLIDWHDVLHFERRSDGQLSREDLGPALPPDDLVLRAARALQAASGTRWGAHIGVLKRIPSEAGMGGGSSDAASCLLALSRLWQLHLPLAELERIGLTLGADLPFFLRGHNAWVEGIGERITPLALPPRRFLVVKPATGLETRRIFSAPDLCRHSEPAILDGFVADPYGFGRNDLQPVAQRLSTDVCQALAWLSDQGLAGRMTGSGSAVFAPLDSSTAVTMAGLATPSGWCIRECGNLEIHPLAGWVS